MVRIWWAANLVAVVFPPVLSLLGLTPLDPKRKHVAREPKVGVGHLGKFNRFQKWHHVPQSGHVELHVGHTLLEGSIRHLFRGVEDFAIAAEDKKPPPPVVDAPSKLVPATGPGVREWGFLGLRSRHSLTLQAKSCPRQGPGFQKISGAGFFRVEGAPFVDAPGIISVACDGVRPGSDVLLRSEEGRPRPSPKGSKIDGAGIKVVLLQSFLGHGSDAYRASSSSWTVQELEWSGGVILLSFQA